jgi:hypothetical protein
MGKKVRRATMAVACPLKRKKTANVWLLYQTMDAESMWKHNRKTLSIIQRSRPATIKLLSWIDQILLWSISLW